MKIYRVTDAEFARYGRVLNMDTCEIVRIGEAEAFPENGSEYLPSYAPFESSDAAKRIKNVCFGGVDVQIGYCYGHNDTLNALEWHTCSEINIAVTDFILLLGDVRELEDGVRYDSSKVKAFLVKKGEAIEVYAATLHFCPIETAKTGFGCVVGLVKGTNTPLAEKTDDARLFKTNKWLIAHENNASLIARGVVAGIYGENIRIAADET